MDNAATEIIHEIIHVAAKAAIIHEIIHVAAKAAIIHEIIHVAAFAAKALQHNWRLGQI